MERIKRILRPIYVPIFNYRNSTFFKHIDLKKNFKVDYQLYKKYSIVFSKKDIKNKEADLILNYHSLEKGFLFKEMKKGFAENRINKLHKMLHDEEVISNVNRDQIRTAYQVMCEYYELHQKANFDIEKLYSKEQYMFYKHVLKDSYSTNFSGKIDWTKDKYYEKVNSNFDDFANSRKSIREFTGEMISHEVLDKVIELANTAPSVCNRQASNVYLLENKKQIDEVLRIQGGFTGYSENVNQLLIVTNDRKYYYTIGERNQLYIDGGLYLMNLLYALHFYQIGNCPANWGMPISKEKELNNVFQIPESEKVICMVPIGKVKDEFRTTLSCRRPIDENFIKL